MRKSDQDRAVESYQSRMSSLARTMSKWADRAVDGMLSDAADLMRRTGYAPESALQWAVKPADSLSFARLAELARSLPEKERKAAMSKLMGQAGAGMTRKKALEQMLRLNARALVGGLGDDVRTRLVSVADEASLRGQFELQKSLNAAWNVDGVNARRIRAMAERTYGDKEAWASLSSVEKEVDRQIARSIALGESPDQMARRVNGVKQTEMWKSKRDARTKITEISNEAHADAYEQHGVKRYRYVATYDERTCPICGRMDGRKYPLSEKKTGVNYPPMHPNCRCTTVAVLSKEVEDKMAPRVLYDKKTKRKVEIPRDFTYEDWYDQYGPGRTGKKFKEASPSPSRVAGFSCGEPMSFEDADGGRVNPNYEAGEGYKENCQTCVFAYEMRRRGYNVEAKPYKKGKTAKLLSNDPASAWIDPETQTKPTYIETESDDLERLTEELKDNLEEGSRYSIQWHRTTPGMPGHIVNLEKINGQLRIYDPQTSVIIEDSGELSVFWSDVDFSQGRKPRLLKLNNLVINQDVARAVLKECGSDGAREDSAMRLGFIR